MDAPCPHTGNWLMYRVVQKKLHKVYCIRMMQSWVTASRGFDQNVQILITTTTTTILWPSGFCPGQTRWAGTRRNIHPLTPIVVINHPLSVSSIYYDPWHPSYSIHVLYSLFPQSLSKFSLVYLLAWHSPLHTPYISSHTQPFYSSLNFVRDNPGELVSEGTFLHLLDFLVQNEDNTGRDTNSPGAIPTTFMPDALPGTTLPILARDRHQICWLR